ncbi:hypothetical protein SAMN06265348_10275 [Pedobacter westerhofensis]|uniref:Uncharacterized protein n=1 Tax=Pedobacter westerhofensis TaxID=425512 RepID=A0A521B853_9SPHI|nr:hypothetical protein SAMN06265348_10275 [Pedobacter westerhofensis]
MTPLGHTSQDLKSKKKKPVIKGTDPNQQLRSRFFERIEYLCDTFAGPGYYKKLPAMIVEHMFMNRYPTLKAKADPSSGIEKSRVVQFNKLMNKFISDRYIVLDNGGKIYLSWYLSEGLLLINYIAEMADVQFPHAAQLVEAFKPYFPGSEVHQMIEEMLIELVHDTTVFLSDYNKTIMNADISATAFFDREAMSNDVMIHELRPNRSSVIIDGEPRTITSLSWLDEDMNWMSTKVRPSLLGFKTGSLDIPLEVYIQKHALDKMQSRINITPGIMHYMTFILMNQEVIRHHKNDNNSLVEYYLSDQKAGYLLVSLVDAKLIIRTFLFLTNDGTPEGKKLNQLLSLDKQDKKYLMIDTLPAFSSYHIDQNEHLSKIFREAGCGPLLKLGHLREYTSIEVKDKDPESIMKYLGDSDSFQGLG